MDRKKLASRVSAALNAPLITLIAFTLLIIYLRAPNSLTVMGITTFFGCLLPLVMVGVLLKLDLIEDFYAQEKDSRFIPFLWTDLFYLAGTIALYLVDAPPAITALMACYVVNGIVLTIITFKWKISIHTSGITGPVTALVYVIGSTMMPLFLTLIPVIWARLELKAHTKMQLTAGAILTSLLTWMQMGFFMHRFLL